MLYYKSRVLKNRQSLNLGKIAKEAKGIILQRKAVATWQKQKRQK